jgi:hypothetical protein
MTCLRVAELCLEVRERVMIQLLQTLFKNCELVVRQERWTLHVSAKGPLAVIAAIIIIFLIAHRP